MANKYSVVRTDNMMGTDVSTYLDSVRFFDANDEAAAIENGHIVKVGALLTKQVGALVTSERELHKATTPAANTPIKEIGLVATPEVFYDERLHNLSDFVNEAGTNVRIYYLHTGDEFSVTEEGVSAAATVAVGNIAELQADTKIKIVASATNGSTVIGKVIAVEKTSRYTYIVIRVD